MGTSWTDAKRLTRAVTFSGGGGMRTEGKDSMVGSAGSPSNTLRWHLRVAGEVTAEPVPVSKQEEGSRQRSSWPDRQRSPDSTRGAMRPEEKDRLVRAVTSASRWQLARSAVEAPRLGIPEAERRGRAEEEKDADEEAPQRRKGLAKSSSLQGVQGAFRAPATLPPLGWRAGSDTNAERHVTNPARDGGPAYDRLSKSPEPRGGSIPARRSTPNRTVSYNSAGALRQQGEPLKSREPPRGYELQASSQQELKAPQRKAPFPWG